MLLSNKSIPDFRCYLRNMKDGGDNPVFGIFNDFSDQINSFVSPVHH